VKIFEIRKFCSKKTSYHIFGKKILSLPNIYHKRYLPIDSHPRFGVSYSIFDGEELLEASISSIRSEVDYVNVVYQTISWHGNSCKESLVPLLKDLKNRGIIDELINWEPDLKKSSQLNEMEKRNAGLKAAKKAQVNYFMTMDCDEFYFADEMKDAQEMILKQGITHSYCAQTLYGRSPTSRQISNHKCCYVQFFSKIDKFSQLGDNEFAPCLVDPTRKILERGRSKHYVLQNIFMHHMSLIRSNLKQKYLNSSGYVKERKIELTLDKEGNFVNVQNYFNIKI
jgi:hypothetical protein